MSTDDRDARLLAALATFSLVMPGWGGSVSLIIYLAARRTLPYAAFHAAQATLLHAAALTLVLAAGAVLGVTLLVGGRESLGGVGSVAFGFLLAVVGLYALLGLFGAALAWRSGFRLPGFARLLAST